MNYFIQSPDIHGYIDGCLVNMVLDHFPNQVSSIAECDVVIVPFTRYQGFRCNDALESISKPWVLLDYSEVEWSYFERYTDSLIYGRYTDGDVPPIIGEYLEFSQWMLRKPPALYFKRELLVKDVNVRLKPIDWPAMQPIPPVQSEAEFHARPIQALFVWGYSHPSRPQLHADIFRAMATRGIDVSANLRQVELAPSTEPRWASIYSPYYDRMRMEDVMWMQRRAKVSVSLPGAGIKCFRHSEAPNSAIMALPQNNLAWSYEWKHGRNCLELGSKSENYFTWLDRYLREVDLYPIYLASQETIAKYQAAHYIANYVEPLIESSL